MTNEIGDQIEDLENLLNQHGVVPTNFRKNKEGKDNAPAIDEGVENEKPPSNEPGNNCDAENPEDICNGCKRALSAIALQGLTEEEIQNVRNELEVSKEEFVKEASKEAKASLRNTIKTTVEDIDRLITERVLETERTITSVIVNDEELPIPEKMVVHEKFEKILTYVQNNVPVFLVSPSGVGKTHMAGQIATVMDLPYYFTSQVTDEYQLLGWKDASGEYQKTPFFDAFTNGGLFLFDELDASVPEAVVKINMALSNKKMAFPHGTFDMHKDFRVIAAGNTIGGANSTYTARGKIDFSTQNRFSVVKMDYDPKMEKHLVTKDTSILFNSIRDYAANNINVEIDFSTRAAMYFDKMKLTQLSIKDLVEDILLPHAEIGDFRGYGVESPNELVKEVSRAINEISEEE